MNKDRRRIVKALPIAAASAAGLGAMLDATPTLANDDLPPSSERKALAGGSPNYSRTVQFDRLLFVAGVLGTDPATRALASPDFDGQCRQALTNLKASVEAGGSTLAKVLKCTCFLVSASDFERFNPVYREFFPAEPPARSTVVVKELVMRGALIEIDCIAHM